MSVGTSSAENVSRTIYCDVLVVGGGGAALRAAYDAAQQGSAVVLALRGPKVGRGGATSFGVVETAGYAIPDGLGDPEDDAQAFRDEVLHTAQGCSDPALVDVLTGEAMAATELLRDNGLEFMRSDDGRELVARGDFASKARNRKILGHGKPIATLLAKLLAGHDRVEVLTSASVVELLRDDQGVQGGLIVDRAGDLMAVVAGATVLATGGAGQLFTHSLMPTDICGSGYALAARAGAILTNMEFVQAGFGTLSPALNMVMPWYWGEGAELLDADLQPILVSQDLDLILAAKRHHYPFSASDLSGQLEIAAHAALSSRPLSVHGGLLMRLPNGAGEDPHGFWALSRGWLQNRGFDVDRGLVEVSLFGHSVNGGVVIDADGRTTVPGLLAAGETTGGAYGADRLGGSMLLACQVFGRRAGRAAHCDARGAGRTMSQVASLIRTATDEFREAVPTGGSRTPRHAMKEAQSLMSRNVLVDRNKESLATAEAELATLADAIGSGDLSADTPSERLVAEDARNLVLVGRFMVKAAKMRTETRGAHYRNDYTSPDPNQARANKWRLLRGDEIVAVSQ